MILASDLAQRYLVFDIDRGYRLLTSIYKLADSNLTHIVEIKRI